MKLTLVPLFAVIVVIALTSYSGKAEESQKPYPAEKLDQILKDHDADYRKEIEELVFKPCLQYVAEFDAALYRNISPDIAQDKLEELVDGMVALEAMSLRKTEPLIYDAVKDATPTERSLMYALIAEQCKKRKTRK